jgi:flagellar biosynthesis GTPase FlhF
MMLLKLVLIIAIMSVVMIVVMIPGVFAVQDNVTIEGNLDPMNRSEEVYVVRVSPSNEHRDIVFSIYNSGEVIFSKTSYIKSGSSYENFFVTFFPPLFQDDTIYTIDVKGPGLLGRQLITVHQEFTSYQSKQLPTVEPDLAIEAKTSEQRAAEQKAAEQKAAEQKAAEQKAAEQKAAEKKAAEKKAAEQKAAEKKAAEQRAIEQRAAEQRAAEKKAAEQRALEQRAAEKKAAEQRAAEAVIRAAEAKAAQDLTNLLIITIAIASISLVIILAKRKKKKSPSNTPQRTTTSTYSPSNTPTNTESSTMSCYECPKCHSADIQNNPDGSVNCPDCGYRN